MKGSSGRRGGLGLKLGVLGLLSLSTTLGGCIGPAYAIPAWAAFTAVLYDIALIPVRALIGNAVLDFINNATP